MKRYIFPILFLLPFFVFVHCKKDSGGKSSNKDTLVSGTVGLYDRYGLNADIPEGVQVTAFRSDSTTLGDSVSVCYSDAEGVYRFDSLPVGTFSLRFQKSGYATYYRHSIKFDKSIPIEVEETKLTVPAEGKVVLHNISTQNMDNGIIEFDREVFFSSSAPTEYGIKTRYFFGLDSSVLQGNAVFTHTVGVAEGAPGASDRQTVKIGYVLLQQYFPDTIVYVAVAVETPQSQPYELDGVTYMPNIALPLTSIQSFAYKIPEDEDDE